jgi:hypothetical protein
MNRRKFLLLSSAAGGVAVLGGLTYARTDHYSRWIQEILHRDLPGYTLEPNGLTQFVDEYFNRQHGDIRLRLFAAAEGIMDIDPVLPATKARKVVEEERRILTKFLLGSDFFANYPGGPKVITYQGMPRACINPFARF